MIANEGERADSIGNCGSEGSGSPQTAEERCIPTKRPIPAKTASTWRGVGAPPWVYAQINTGSPRVDQVTAMSPEASLPLLPVLSPTRQLLGRPARNRLSPVLQSNIQPVRRS